MKTSPKTKQPRAGDVWSADKRAVVVIVRTGHDRFYLAALELGRTPLTAAALQAHQEANQFRRIGAVALLNEPAARSQEPSGKAETMVELFASMPATERTATLARLVSLMHPGPTSQEHTP